MKVYHKLISVPPSDDTACIKVDVAEQDHHSDSFLDQPFSDVDY